MLKSKCLVLFFFGVLTFNAFAQGKYITDAGIAINVGDFEQAEKALVKAWEILEQKQKNNEKIEAKDLRKYWRYKEHVYARLAEKQDSIPLKLNYTDLSKEAAFKYFQVDETNYFEGEVKDDMKFLASLYQFIGVDFFNNKDFNQASKMFAEAIAIKKFLGTEKEDMRVYHNAAFSAYYDLNYKAAIPLFNELITAKYNAEGSLINYKKALVQSYSKQGDKQTALLKINEFNTGDTINPDLLKEEISLLLDMKKTNEALAKMDVLVSKGFQDALTYENMGKLYEQIGELEKATKAYQQALGIDPKRSDSYYGLGKIICQQYNTLNAQEKEKLAIQKFNEAAVFIEKAVEIAPNDKDSLKLLLQIYENLGETDKAASIKDKLSKL